MNRRCERSMRLEQTWNLQKGYIKPLLFPSSQLSKTFFFTAKNKSDFHFSILGAFSQPANDQSEMIQAIDKHFREAVLGFDDIYQVANTLSHKLDESHSDMDVSFQLWARHDRLDYIPVISMGTPAMKLITRDYNDVVLDYAVDPNLQNEKPCLKSTIVPIAQTQYLIFATDASYLPTYVSKSDVKLDSIFELSKHLGEVIGKAKSDSKGEVSLLLMDLHDYAVTSESTFYGLDNYDMHIEAILNTIPPTYDRFAVKLILSELLMNAYKYGNCVDHRLPIKVICGISDDELVLEVLDTGIRLEDIPIKTLITPEDLLEENGRGLYLVNAFSDSLTIDNNSVVSRIKCKKIEC